MIDYCIYDGELYHFNPFHDNLGRFASSRLGRTYVGRNGKLTDKGKRRLNVTSAGSPASAAAAASSDSGSSGGKKKKDKIRIDKNGRVIDEDIDKAAKAIHDEIQKDYSSISDTLKTGSGITDKVSGLRDKVKSNQAAREVASMDLSKMSDADLNTYINRANLEKRFREVRTADVKRGKDKLDEVLEYAGAALGIAASAVAIAAAIHEMQSKD